MTFLSTRPGSPNGRPSQWRGELIITSHGTVAPGMPIVRRRVVHILMGDPHRSGVTTSSVYHDRPSREQKQRRDEDAPFRDGSDSYRNRKILMRAKQLRWNAYSGLLIGSQLRFPAEEPRETGRHSAFFGTKTRAQETRISKALIAWFDRSSVTRSATE